MNADRLGEHYYSAAQAVFVIETRQASERKPSTDGVFCVLHVKNVKDIRRFMANE